MKILILGFSSLSIRKIIPALKKSSKKFKFEICSVSKSKKSIGESKWFRNYNVALTKSNADIVYISLQNSKHFYWAKKFLENKFHVIIDKPATLSLKEAKELVGIAKKNKKLLSEAVIFNYHAQFKQLLKEITNKDKLESVLSNFKIPQLPKNNFRNFPTHGGGCFNDMSPYAAVLFRIFINKKLTKDKIYFTSINKNKLNISFNFFAYLKKIIFFSSFSFNDNYQNELTLVTSKKILKIYRVFSPPSDKKLKILIHYKDQNKNITKLIKKDDIFVNYFNDIYKSLKNRRFLDYYKILLKDSNFREKIKKN